MRRATRPSPRFRMRSGARYLCTRTDWYTGDSSFPWNYCVWLSWPECSCMLVVNLQVSYFSQIFHLLSCELIQQPTSIKKLKSSIPCPVIGLFSYLLPFGSSLYISLTFVQEFIDRTLFLNICSQTLLLKDGMVVPNIKTEISNQYILLAIAGLVCLQIFILRLTHPLCRVPSAHWSVKWCGWYNMYMKYAYNIALTHYNAHLDPGGPNGIRPVVRTGLNEVSIMTAEGLKTVFGSGFARTSSYSVFWNFGQPLLPSGSILIYRW